MYLKAVLSPSNHFLIFDKNQLGMFAPYMYNFSIKKILPYKVSWKTSFHSVFGRLDKIAINSLFSKDLQCNHMDMEFLFKRLSITFKKGFPGGSDGKESVCSERDLSSTPGSGIPSSTKWQPSSVFLPGESHGQRSLVGYSPWGDKELDTTEQLMLAWL